MKINISIFKLLASLLFILTGFIVPLFGNAVTRWAFFNLSYAWMSLLFCSFLWVLLPYLSRQNWGAFKKPITLFILTSLLAATVIFITNPSEMKVNSDEACILSVANQFTTTQKPYNATEAKHYFDTFHPLNLETPVRPLFFPFFISLIQKIVGVNFTSAILSNLIIAFLFLFLTQFIFYLSSQSLIMGIVGGAFLFSLPLFQIYATSSGFDLASCFFLALSLFFAIKALQKETDSNQGLFLLSLCLFSHIRYENPLHAGIIGAYVFFLSKNKKKLLFRWEFALVTSSLCLHLWQRVLTPNLLQGGGGRSVFSILNFLDNFKSLIHSLVQLEAPLNPILTVLFIPAAGLLFFHQQFKKEIKFSFLILIAILLPTLFNLTAIGGIYSHPATVRYYFPLAIGSTLLVPWVMMKFFKNDTRIMPLAAGLNWLFFTLTPAHYDYINTLELNRDLHQIYGFVENQHSKRFLSIYDRPVQLTALGYGAINFQRAKREIIKIQEELQNGLYDHVYAFEDTTYSEQNKRWSSPANGFHEIRHFQQHGDHVMFISELDKSFKFLSSEETLPDTDDF